MVRKKETDENIEEAPTRMKHTTRRGNETQRYTIDLDREQRKTLNLCAAEWEVGKSRIVRTLIYLLEADKTLRDRVEREMFEGEDAQEEETDDS